MGSLNIWPEPVRREGDSIVASATVEMPNGKQRILWYKVPEEHMASLHPACDPFVVGTVCLLMQTGQKVHVRGQVSPSLLRNLGEFQAAWTCWLPGLRVVEIFADREAEAVVPDDRKGALVAFSGGVDSCFTAFRHARRIGLRFPRKVAAGVMVHGFDIPLEEPESFASAAERSRVLLSSLGLDLIRVATNYRTVVSDWSHSYGAAVASCLMLLAGRFREGLIGQGLSYDFFRDYVEGSNPLTDSLLGSETFPLLPDGSAQNRVDKVRVVGEWAELRQHLRVCWQGERKDRNCCHCEKCIRNILTFRALGLGLPECFEFDVGDSQIRRLPGSLDAVMRYRYEPIIRAAEERGVTDSWVRVLRRQIRKNYINQRPGIWRDLHGLAHRARRIGARLVLPARRWMRRSSESPPH